MPYIEFSRRKEFANWNSTAETPGELNYKLTEECIKYFEDHGKSYKTINDIVGALECCKQEFYRRLAAPYEDIKIIQNGDVYDVDLPS